MFSKITTTWCHQVVVGRGRFRNYLFKINKTKSSLCRFGCNVPETVDHILLKCDVLSTERKCIKDTFVGNGITFKINNILTHPTLKTPVEMLLTVIIRFDDE